MRASDADNKRKMENEAKGYRGIICIVLLTDVSDLQIPNWDHDKLGFTLKLKTVGFQVLQSFIV